MFFQIETKCKISLGRNKMFGVASITTAILNCAIKCKYSPFQTKPSKLWCVQMTECLIIVSLVYFPVRTKKHKADMNINLNDKVNSKERK